MAATKKTVATTAAKKVEEPKTEAKKTVTPVTTTAKTESEKATVKPVETAKKEEAKVEKKETVKKEAVKKPAAKKETAVKAAAKKAPAKKAELKSELHIQFGGNSYSQEDLIKIAKDVWKYDLKQKAGDLTSVELYVKPEEHMVYYVMNKEITGSFYI